MNSFTFDNVFGPSDSTAFSASAVETIKNNRQKFDGTLFVDRLLQAVGLDNGTNKSLGRKLFNNCLTQTGPIVYPPQSHSGLQSLFQVIVDTDAPNHHIQALLFYIIQDLKSKKSGAALFANSHHVLSTYRILIEGLWHLDHGRFDDAVDSLTDPCLTPTFETEILSTLIKHGKDPRLALTYYSTLPKKNVSSIISEPLIELVARMSPIEALLLTRSQYGTMDARQSAFETFICTLLSETEAARYEHDGIILTELPLDADEETWLKVCINRKKEIDSESSIAALVLRGLSKRQSKDSAQLLRGVQRLRLANMDY